MKTRRRFKRKGGKRRGEGGGKSYASMVSGTKKNTEQLSPTMVPLSPPMVPLSSAIAPPINMGQTYSYDPLASYSLIRKYFDIEETQEGIETIKTIFGNPNNNLCRRMMTFFPAFSIEPAKKHNLSEEDSKKFRTIVCSLLYIFGTFTKHLNKSKYGKINKIIVKGGTALKLLTSNPMIQNPQFKYDSEDIDILVTGKNAKDFASEIAACIKWIYATEVPNKKNQWYYNSILQIEPQTRGLPVIKMYFVVPGKKIAICDIEYKEEVDNPYYTDDKLVTTENNNMMFQCQSIQAFYEEKEMLYNKYSDMCVEHNCTESSDKPECKECNFLKKKFKKPIDAIQSFYKQNNI